MPVPKNVNKAKAMREIAILFDAPNPKIARCTTAQDSKNFVYMLGILKELQSATHIGTAKRRRARSTHESYMQWLLQKIGCGLRKCLFAH
jgi:hypothetical protein